jgi:hypothetical protein
MMGVRLKQINLNKQRKHIKYYQVCVFGCKDKALCGVYIALMTDELVCVGVGLT